jgi:diguanylate cyclase (GGDEF)-like protein/PAS domain S-box-containing protein
MPLPAALQASLNLLQPGLAAAAVDEVPQALHPNTELDLVMTLARQIFKAAVCLVSWRQDDRLWFTAGMGHDVHCQPLNDSLCQAAILTDQAIVCPDMRGDPRFDAHQAVDGTVMSLRFFASAPLRNAQGEVMGAMCVLDPSPRLNPDADATEQIQELADLAMHAIAHTQLGLERDKDLQLFASGPVAALVWDGSTPNRLISQSGNMREVVGTRLNLCLQEGQTFEQLIHPDEVSDFRMALRSHAMERLPRQEISYRLRSGRRWVQQVTQGDYADDGRLLRIRGYLMDITRQKELEASLESTKERLGLALEASNTGTWDMNFKTRKRLVSARTAVMIGLRADDVELDLEHWHQLIHPLDRARVTQLLMAAVPMEGGPSESPMFSMAYRLRHKQGHCLWVQSTGRLVERDADGRPERAVGTLIDITEVKRLEARRTKQQVLLDLLNEVQRTFLLDRDIHEACKALFKPLLKLTESQFGFIGIVRHSDAGELSLEVPSISNLSWDAASASWQDQHLPTGQRMVFTNLDNLFGHVITQHTTVMRNDLGTPGHGQSMPPGHPVLESFMGIPLSFQGRALGMIALGNRLEGFDQETLDLLQPLAVTLGTLLHARELEDQRLAMEAQLQRQAAQDTLTGLFNRRRFHEAVTDQLHQARRYHVDMTLALMDVDFFKQVNDQHGHAAGDAVLRAFADVLQQVTRDSDVVARVGGEEFAVLLTSTDAAHAKAGLERIRSSVEQMRVVFNGAEIRVTVSIGALAWHEQVTDIDPWLHGADQALYRAKAGGRNRVEIEAPPLPLTRHADVVLPFAKPLQR